MGIHSFRLPPPDLLPASPDLRKGYFTGQDRMPMRTAVELRGDLLICHRDNPESGRFNVPWPVKNGGTPVLSTATLMERAQPYDLAVELARGKINDIRNQLADWKQMGLQSPPELETTLSEAQRQFARAAIHRDDPAEAFRLSQTALASAWKAGAMLMESYTRQVLQTRLTYAPKLPTLLGCVLRHDPGSAPWGGKLAEGLNAARIGCSWSQAAPTEGQIRWDLFDSQLAWCQKRGFVPAAGPLVEFRSGAVPDWLWLFQGDAQGILGLAVEWVRQALTRYRGKVAVWHLAHRVGTGKFLGLSEDDQIGITARVFQVARQIDPNAQLIVDFERPWAEWLGGPSTAQLGPLHLADSLARADLGLSGIGLEVAPGYSPPGSQLRDLLEFSKLLDLYALINLPLHITLAFPSGTGPDAMAPETMSVAGPQWGGLCNEMTQQQWATRWIALAAAKPFVRSVAWAHASDQEPHLYPHAGLFRPNGSPKPLFDWMRTFRQDYLE